MKNKYHNPNKNSKSLPKSTSQQKSKQKSKDKTKKFNPLQYLNALIQLTNNTNVLKTKHKKTTQKRDLSSALTVATPGMQQTISTSKIRCKSSYSQYRKKSTTNNLKQILNLKFNNYIITEEQDPTNCIQFTSISSSNNSNHQTPIAQKQFSLFQKYQPNPTNLQLKPHFQTIDYNHFAIKIQRAWRSFQTYKMVRKYYKQFKKENKSLKIQKQNQTKFQHVPRNSQYTPRNYLPQPSQTFKSSKISQIPSNQPYLSDSLGLSNLSISKENDSNEDFFQKTIKFKIKNQESQISKKQFQKQERIKRENSSSQNQLNLTQKLNQLKQFVQNESLSQSKNQVSIQQIPTIEMKKDRVTYQNLRSQNIVSFQQNQKLRKQFEQNQNFRQQEDSTTQKKNKYERISYKLQHINEIPLALCQSKGQNNLREVRGKQKVEDKVNKSCMVDHMIKKETQKYNEILSLIEGCKLKDKEVNKTQFILSELLNRLQKHKQQLLIPKQESVQKVNLKGQKLKIQDSSQSKVSNESFIAFDSRDVYNQFEEYDFNSGKKSIKGINNIRQESKRRQEEEKLREESEKRIQSLRRYYDLLSNESEKLQNLMGRQEGRNIGIEDIDLGISSVDDSESFQYQREQLNYQREHVNEEGQSYSREQSSQLRESKMYQKESKMYQKEQKMYQKEQKMYLREQGSELLDLQSQIPSKGQIDNNIKSNKSFQSQEQDSSSMYSFCSQTFSEDSVNKMFNQHLNLLQSKRNKSIQNLQQLILSNQLSYSLYSSNLKQINFRYQQQTQSILYKKHQYLKNLKSVKKQTLNFQKDLISQNKSHRKRQLQQKRNQKNILNDIDEKNIIKKSVSYGSLGIRKSFSAQSIVLKCILKQPFLKNKDLRIEQYLITNQEIQVTQKQKDENKQYNTKKDKNELFKAQKDKDMDVQDKKQKDKHRQKEVQGDGFDHNQKQNQIQDNKQNSLQQKENHNIKTNKYLQDQNTNLNKHQQLFQQTHYKQLIHQESQHKDSLTQKLYTSYQENQQHHLSPITQQKTYYVVDNNNTQHNQNQDLSQKLLPLHPHTNLNQDHIKDADLDQDHVKDTNLNQDHILPQSKQYQPQSSLQIIVNQTNLINIPSQMRQKCSQQIQKIIQTHLITQYIEEIYLNDHLIQIFKPFIEDIYSFTPITDSNVMHFAQIQLTKYFPPYHQLLLKANQKINPTSSEILRLVRDFQFQIDQYQLILSQDIFKQARKYLQIQYQQKISNLKNLPIKHNTITSNPQIVDKIHQKEINKRTKIAKYMEYQRDMKIMYLKAVFNCLNEFLIQEKSIATHVNTRTNIGAGQLSMSIKEFNAVFDKEETDELFRKSYERMEKILKNKCMLPVFKNYKDVSMFQQQMLKMIRNEFEETEYKWVTYMDEVLEIWNQVANNIVKDMIKEAVQQISSLLEIQQKQ